MKIAGKVAVITGGASGMGAEVALYLSQMGAKVAILDINNSLADSITSKINGLAFKCDVTSEDSVTKALASVTEQLGPIYVTVNCAGIAPAKRILGRNGPMPLAEFEKIIKINLIGTFNVLRLAADFMAKNEPVESDEERGVIINTASIAAYEGQIGQAAYSASKGGIVSMTLPAARDLSDFNIRVVAIAPGLIQTPLLENLPDMVQEGLAAQIVFPKRFGKPVEFAMLVEHIIQNPYINGEVLRLDGGLRMAAK